MRLPPEGVALHLGERRQQDASAAARAAWALSYNPPVGLLRRAVAGGTAANAVLAAAEGLAHGMDTHTVMLVGA